MRSYFQRTPRLCGYPRGRVISLLEVIIGPFFAAPTDLSLAGSTPAASDDLDSDEGLVVGLGRRKSRFVRYPDGEFRAVDHDFDASVFDDPDAVPMAERRKIEVSILDVPSELRADDNILGAETVRTIAESMLTARPRSLVAVAHDSQGVVLGATITPAPRRLALATFRASLKSLPTRTKQVTFAAGQPMPPGIQTAVSEIADIAFVRVIDFLLIE